MFYANSKPGVYVRSASTSELTEAIRAKLISSECKADLRLEYYEGGAWKSLMNDLDGATGVDWKKSAKLYQYANFALTPEVSSIGFTLLNPSGKYSEGSGTIYENVIDLDTKIRLLAGYRMDSGIESSETLPLNSALYSFNFYTKYSGGIIILDSINSGALTEKYMQDKFNLYDALNYDGGYYSPSAITVQIFDNSGYRDVTKFTVTANNSYGKVYYKAAYDIDGDNFGEWTYAGATINGAKDFTVSNSNGERYFLIMIMYDGINWSMDLQISQIDVYSENNIEWIYRDVFYLDTPSFTDPKAPSMPTVKCSGRDIWKRAIETDINLHDMTAGVTLDDLIKLICDKIGIGYSATSIADLSGFAARTLSSGLGEIQKADEVLGYIMAIINQTGFAYNMYLEYDSVADENILFVQPAPTAYAADFVFNFRYYDSLGDKRKNYDKYLMRFTAITDEKAPTDERQLATANYNTVGTKTLSWAGDAEYKRYTVVVNSGDAVVALTDMNPTSLVFAITGTAIDVTITAYGCKWASGAPYYEGEYLAHDSVVAKRGLTYKHINPLILTDAEAKAISKGFIEKYGSPINEANDLKYPYLNLLLEQNDMTLLWSRFVFVDDLYYVTGIDYHWDISESPADTTIFALDDSGINFSDLGNYIYDALLDYDIGYVYDMILGPAATDSEIDVYSDARVVHNVDFS